MQNLINRKPSRKKTTVTFSIPKVALFVGSYYRIRVRLTGIIFDKINFVVPDGAKAAIISPSRDATFNPKRPHIMLCVGHEPGTYVIDKTGGPLLFQPFASSQVRGLATGRGS